MLHDIQALCLSQLEREGHCHAVCIRIELNIFVCQKQQKGNHNKRTECNGDGERGNECRSRTEPEREIKLIIKTHTHDMHTHMHTRAYTPWKRPMSWSTLTLSQYQQSGSKLVAGQANRNVYVSARSSKSMQHTNRQKNTPTQTQTSTTTQTQTSTTTQTQANKQVSVEYRVVIVMLESDSGGWKQTPSSPVAGSVHLSASSGVICCDEKGGTFAMRPTV